MAVTRVLPTVSYEEISVIRRQFITALAVCAAVSFAVPASSFAREKSEKPKQEDKHKGSKPKGGKHRDDGPNHK